MARYVSPPHAEKIHQLYLQAAVHLQPTPAPRICRDESDDYLLSLASAADADTLVTRDEDLLALKTHGRTEIVYPARFLQILAAAREPN